MVVFTNLPKLKNSMQILEDVKIEDFNDQLKLASEEANEWLRISKQQIATEQKIKTIVSPIELSVNFATEQILDSIANNRFMALGFNQFDSSFTPEGTPVGTRPRCRFGFIDREMT